MGEDVDDLNFMRLREVQVAKRINNPPPVPAPGEKACLCVRTVISRPGDCLDMAMSNWSRSIELLTFVHSAG